MEWVQQLRQSDSIWLWWNLTTNGAESVLVVNCQAWKGVSIKSGNSGWMSLQHQLWLCVRFYTVPLSFGTVCFVWFTIIQAESSNEVDDENQSQRYLFLTLYTLEFLKWITSGSLCWLSVSSLTDGKQIYFLAHHCIERGVLLIGNIQD